ncbi:hypothetical protein BOH78_5149 [Pichia kudriavzevii]|uniref:Uncharacterized protein n=1 Tax=Pichia kudriavzevii TaxID=4909 RepID=A0A1V2LFV0_PICKU|nr:hypothetical protein BOH78_5149 [Pichia kudriavzevii]
MSCMRRDGKESTINLSFDSMLPISLRADIEPVFNTDIYLRRLTLYYTEHGIIDVLKNEVKDIGYEQLLRPKAATSIHPLKSQNTQEKRVTGIRSRDLFEIILLEPKSIVPDQWKLDSVFIGYRKKCVIYVYNVGLFPAIIWLLSLILVIVKQHCLNILFL